ncbi:hypothetical protein LXA43DRAFT_969255 [Ganoderma leucocontextum]|nr:hypothetical protein LXA43DRAFT_969255 [Ganoderma leucocontextum]
MLANRLRPTDRRERVMSSLLDWDAISVNSLSAYSQALKKPAFTVYIQPALYLELDVNRLREDDMEHIYAELQGTILTEAFYFISYFWPGSDQFQVIANEFLRETVTLWVRERAARPASGDVMNIPFELKLPEDAPPSFGFESYMNNAHVRYAVEVVGVGSATFAVNSRTKFPVVVVPNDPVCNGTRAQLKLGWPNAWGRLKIEDKVRKYPWGEYSHVRMERVHLAVSPHVDTFPLFTDIPYTIVITTLFAPTRRKDNAGPDKSLFPQVPRSACVVFVEMETPYQPSNPEEHVVDIISKAHAPIPPVKVEFGEHTWIPEEEREDRGRWRQEATFSSSMNLRYTPTFVTEEVKVKYTLFLRVEFSGSANALRLCMPIPLALASSAPTPSAGRAPSGVRLRPKAPGT